MPYIYSTLSCDNEYRGYKKGGADLPTVEKSVLIKGGAGLANKNIITPLGVATEVSKEDVAFLEAHESFQLHLKNGYVSIEAKKEDADKVASSMNKRDKSAPVVPEDYANAEKAPKVAKV